MKTQLKDHTTISNTDATVSSHLTGPYYLPGDLHYHHPIHKTALQPSQLQSMLRVDHAGEYGATRIYQGQIHVFGAKQDSQSQAMTQNLQHMLEQEKKHLDWFENEMRQQKVRPSLLMPLWHYLGFALGVATAKMGKAAAMTCTVAVESEIEQHYQQQIDALTTHDTNSDEIHMMKTHIEQFRNEEIEHHDLALDQGGSKGSINFILDKMIKLGAKVSIEVAKKI